MCMAQTCPPLSWEKLGDHVLLSAPYAQGLLPLTATTWSYFWSKSHLPTYFQLVFKVFWSFSRLAKLFNLWDQAGKRDSILGILWRLQWLSISEVPCKVAVFVIWVSIIVPFRHMAFLLSQDILKYKILVILIIFSLILMIARKYWFYVQSEICLYQGQGRNMALEPQQVKRNKNKLWKNCNGKLVHARHC